MLVVATDATHKSEDVESQHQDDHAKHGHTADPPAAQTHKLINNTITDRLTITKKVVRLNKLP